MKNTLAIKQPQTNNRRLLAATATAAASTVIVMAMVLACGQRYNAESDFMAKPVGDGTKVEITGYRGDAFIVRIPPRVYGFSVISIGAQAFQDQTSITSVTIPSSVTSIGNFAFYGCESLTSVTIPNSVVSIGDYAFAYCSSLDGITIPKNITGMGDAAFRSCENLKSVTFRAHMESLPAGIFEGDLSDKYRADGPGTYTTTAPVGGTSTWTKR